MSFADLVLKTMRKEKEGLDYEGVLVTLFTIQKKIEDDYVPMVEKLFGSNFFDSALFDDSSRLHTMLLEICIYNLTKDKDKVDHLIDTYYQLLYDNTLVLNGSEIKTIQDFINYIK
jgi:hypothetical protein